MRQYKNRGEENAPPTLVNWDVADTLLQPGQPTYKQPMQIPDQVAGRFSSIRQVGRGSAGVVYAAFDEDLGRPVALKALTQPIGHQGVQSLAQREARAIATLHHPNIVTLYDWIPGNELTWLVMEYVDGPSLAELIQTQGSLPAAQVVNLVVQVCRALDYAHQKGIWHLDIKPANIIVGPGGIPKIADFGIAQTRLPGDSDAGLGTPGYAPMEQLAREPVQQSDVYAVGALALALLSGEQVPDVNNKSLWRVVPAVLRPALKAALSAQPHARPKTPAALADWLESAWAARHKTQLMLITRAWDVIVVGALAGGVMRLISVNGPLALFTHSDTITWVGVLLALLGAIRPVAALFVVMLFFTAGLIWHVPTLGLLMILLWPLLALWLRINPRSLSLLLLTPFAGSIGLLAVPPILAGAILSPANAAWVSAAGVLLTSATKGMLATYSVQESLLHPMASVFQVLVRISPRDLLFSVLPAAWYNMSAPTALWLAFLAAALAVALAWLRDHATPPMLFCGAAGLLLCHQIVMLGLLGTFSVGHFLISLVIAMVALTASPARTVEIWDYIRSWWLGFRANYSRFH
jgi:hypothetical protein